MPSSLISRKSPPRFPHDDDLPPRGVTSQFSPPLIVSSFSFLTGTVSPPFRIGGFFFFEATQSIQSLLERFDPPLPSECEGIVFRILRRRFFFLLFSLYEVEQALSSLFLANEAPFLS